MTTSPYLLPEPAENDELQDLRSSGAAQRALDFYLKEEMSTPVANEALFAIKAGISQSGRSLDTCLGPAAQRGGHCV